MLRVLTLGVRAERYQGEACVRAPPELYLHIFLGNILHRRKMIDNLTLFDVPGQSLDEQRAVLVLVAHILLYPIYISVLLARGSHPVPVYIEEQNQC